MTTQLDLLAGIASKPTHLQVIAYVRYWDDAQVNGIQASEDGSNTPLKRADGAWAPRIRLSDGVILDWPQGTTAQVYYKVCDSGSYYLQNDQFETIAMRECNYVPACLAIDDKGYGDYIIMTIDATGKIANWRNHLDPADWQPVAN